MRGRWEALEAAAGGDGERTGGTECWKGRRGKHFDEKDRPEERIRLVRTPRGTRSHKQAIGFASFQVTQGLYPRNQSACPHAAQRASVDEWARPGRPLQAQVCSRSS